MKELLNSLGIDIKLLIFQIFNFFILFFILYKFLSKPLNSIINERKAQIEEGFKKYEEALSLIKKINKIKKKILAKAEKEKEKILFEAQEEKNLILQKALIEAQIEKDKAKSRLKKELEAEKQNFLNQVEKDSVELFFSLAKKIFNRSDLDKDYIKKILANK